MMFDALTIVTRTGALPRAEMARFLRSCFDDLRPVQTCFVWNGWQEAVATLGLAELKPLVKDAFARGSIDPAWLEFEDFEQDLDHAVANPTAPPRVGGDFTLFGDVVEELSTWYCFSEKYEAEQRRWQAERLRRESEREPSIWSAYPEPAVNPYRGLGRNDPCPCGSGRKFKKCCLNASLNRPLDAA
jgi:uncharacterized protein